MTKGGELQDLLKQAADIKSAQLKARPGRQEWESSPEFIKYTAYKDDVVEQLRQAEPDERLDAALALKEEGNAQINMDPAVALRLYTRAIGVFMWFDRGKDRASEDIPLVNSVTQLQDEGLRGKASSLMATLFCNAALCLLKQHLNDDAIYAASKALEFDEWHVKALYRRGQAHYAQGTSTGLEAAVADLTHALRLEPGNAQVRATLSVYQQELMEQNRRDRATFGSMFDRGGRLYSEEELEQMRAAAAASAGKAGAAGQVLDGAGEEGEDDEGFGREKSSTPSQEEVQRMVRGMQRSMQRARAQTPQRLPPEPSMFSFPRLPWWGWALIGLHLLYRIGKMWRAPLPVTHHMQPAPDVSPALDIADNHQEL